MLQVIKLRNKHTEALRLSLATALHLKAESVAEELSRRLCIGYLAAIMVNVRLECMHSRQLRLEAPTVVRKDDDGVSVPI